jgi:NAD(P)-dependent dehydrogenase (short-subunit alcohol dehydrogenase family)
MEYFVTGASGFIGKRLVRKLLARRGAVVHFLVRPSSEDKVAALLEYWGADGRRARAVPGDLTQPLLGVSPSDREALAGRIDHFFHLAAIYDLTASAESQLAANIDGTRNAVALANAIGARRFQHMSSIAVAGLYDGIFREDMFEEAENLDHPYFRSKHEAERIVRAECRMPWRAYRPSMVVGDSRTGEMDKVDGPYYMFKLIQRMREIMPPWLPAIGVEGGRSNMVPVDFVVAATDHIAHARDGDGRAFHLVDPVPYRMGDALNIFARAAHAPKFALKVNPGALLGFIPAAVRKGLLSLAPVQRIRANVMKDLGLPEQLLEIGDFNTRFDCRDAAAALEGSGIECPRLEDYGYRLWDYWERNLDPELFIDHTLKGQVSGKVVLITGGSQGIGLASAHKIAAAGAITVIAARDQDKLDIAQKEIETALGANANGGKVVAISADLSSMESCDRLVARLVKDYGGVDVLVNNAGRSIRRGIEASYDRFHDFERTMQLNYFGCLRVTLGLLPHMAAKKKGHIVNVSTLGVLTNAPRFSAYVASKAALDAWTRCAASEYIDVGVTFTTINMPLVRTAMIAPTKIYNNIPTLAPEEAADMVVDAIINKPVRIAPREGVIGEVLHALAPRVMQILMNAGYRMFADSDRARGSKDEGKATADQIAFANLVRGVHM